MKNYLKILVVLLCGITGAFFSYKLAYAISEKYFFDKLFYRKSAMHGYLNVEWGDYTNIQNNEINKRISDILLITQEKNDSEEKVLGASDNNEYRIAVLGDSFVYGWGIRKGERFSKMLENNLSKKRPTKVFILGLPGDGILDNLAKYKLAEAKLRPNLTILMFANNDFSIDWINRYPGEEELFGKLKSKCPGEVFMFDWNQYSNWSWKKLFLTAFFPAATDNYSNSCIFLDALREMDNQKIIFFPTNTIPKNEISLPENFSNSDQELFIKHEWLMQKLKNLIKTQDGFILDYDYNNIPNDLISVSDSEGHFSKFTNKMIAEILYKEITNNERWGFIK